MSPGAGASAGGFRALLQTVPFSNKSPPGHDRPRCLFPEPSGLAECGRSPRPNLASVNPRLYSSLTLQCDTLPRE